MKLILHGELKKRYGDSVEFNSPTVADAIEGFSRQAKDWPRHMVVEAVGFDSEDKLKAPTSVQAVHLIPAMCGGGPIGKIIVGVAIIATLVAFPETATALLGISGCWAGVALGAALILGGIMQLLNKTPAQKLKDSQYLGGGTNTTAIGTPITMAWGRVPLSPHWLSVAVNSNQMAYGAFPASPT